MKQRSALVLPLLTILSLAACSKDEATTKAGPAGAAAPGASAAKPATEERIAKIPILPGYKYYAGGPQMKKDPYGHFRIQRFNGEVQQPPSRGMIFGAKVDGDQMEYRVWGNALLLGVHKGIMRGGVFWQEYAEGYRDGKLVARETTVNDDAAKVSRISTQDIDPENGEVIRTKEATLSYLPPVLPADMDSDDEVAVPAVKGADPVAKDAVPAAKEAAPAVNGAVPPVPGAAK